MTTSTGSTRTRQGAIAPLMLLLLVALVGVLAFAIDIGWIALAKANLHTAADSAALAGAGQLMDAYLQYNLPGQTQKSSILQTAKAKAIAAAKQYAAYNYAGEITSLELKDADVEFGFTDDKNKYTPEPKYQGFPNTVKVTMRRDSTANGSLGLIFGRIFGITSTDVTISAAATIFTAEINGFQTGIRNVLPAAYDVNHWSDFLRTGLDPDGIQSRDSLGNPTLKVYPSTEFSGNFGLISLDSNNAGASTIKSWVDTGMSNSDLASLKSKNLLPLSSHDTNQWDWRGETGMKSSVIDAIGQRVGDTFILPLFKPYDANEANYQAGTGTGDSYQYNIVQFVAAKVVSTTNGVLVTPSAMVVDDDKFLLINAKAAGTGSGSGLTSTFLPPKLTQ